MCVVKYLAKSLNFHNISGLCKKNNPKKNMEHNWIGIAAVIPNGPLNIKHYIFCLSFEEVISLFDRNLQLFLNSFFPPVTTLYGFISLFCSCSFFVIHIAISAQFFVDLFIMQSNDFRFQSIVLLGQNLSFIF